MCIAWTTTGRPACSPCTTAGANPPPPAAPSRWPWPATAPAVDAAARDLRTRLGWDLVFRLDPLSDADKLAALSAQAAERGMHLAPEIINWMLTHHERDIRKLAALIDALDRYSLANGRPITLPCCAMLADPDSHPMTSPRLALFDLDHTLLPLDSDYQWADYLARTGRAGDPDEARRRNDELMERYNRGELTAEQAAEFMLGLLAAHPPYELAAWHEAFMAEVIRPSITSARALVDEHLQAGDLCAVVTATNGFVTAPIARAFGIPT